MRSPRRLYASVHAMKVRVITGGWYWHSRRQDVGTVIDGQSEEWIAHRVRDGLVEVMADSSAPLETAAIAPAETAVLPSQRGSAKQRKS